MPRVVGSGYARYPDDELPPGVEGPRNASSYVVLYGGYCEVRTEIGVLDTFRKMVEHMYIHYRIDGHAFSY